MKIDIFGVEEKSFKDKKDGSDVVYYRAYGYKPTKRNKGHGCVYCEIKIAKDCFNDIAENIDIKDNYAAVTVEFEFDENGRVTDWVVM